MVVLLDHWHVKYISDTNNMCGNYHSTNVLQQDMQNFGRNVTSTPFLRFGEDLGFNSDSQIVVPQTRVQVLSPGGDDM